MNILLINHYAGSPRHGMEYRPYYIAREWVRAGHNVTIAAASFSHLRIQQPKIDKRWAEEDIDGIRYVWLKTPHYEGNGARRVLNMAAFTRQLRRNKAVVAGGNKFDAVIASSPHPLVIYPARRIAATHGAKLVFEVRDLWPLTLTELSGMSRRHPFIRWLQFTENYAYRHADRVVCTLPKADRYMVAHGMDEGKFACIPNGICLEEWERARLPMPEQHAATLAGLKKQGKFLIGYVGQHSLSNALDSFIEAAVMLSELNVSFVLVGQGPEKERLASMAAAAGATNVVFLPPVARQMVPAVLDAMDALFIGWNRQPLYRYGISPNKLTDYMMAGKPVIHAVEAGNDPVAASGCGVSCRPEDPMAIAEAVRSLLARNDAERRSLGQRGAQYAREHHDYVKLAEDFLRIAGGRF